MKNHLSVISFTCATIAFIVIAPAAHAQSAFYDFNAIAAGTRTPLSLTNSGITADFTANTGTFVVQDSTGSFNVPFSGNALASSSSSQTLIVSLSQSVTGLSADFGAFIPGATVTVQLFSSAVPVGSQTFTATASGAAYQGTVSLSGTSFDSVQIYSNSPFLAIDNLRVGTSAAPEPGTARLLAACLLPLVGTVVRRRRK